MSEGISGAADPQQYIAIPKVTLLRGGITLLLGVGLIAGAYALHSSSEYGAKAAISLLVGASLGIAFERGRFCFFCILRDFIEKRDSTGIFAILAALAVGAVGYAVVFGAFLPNAMSGRMPPGAHIGPVSWVLVVAGIAFGVGMSLSGACISGHLYRLGQGYTRAPLALIGAAVGFGLGFFTWQKVYLEALSKAPVAWLPTTLGYGGSLLLTLGLLLVIGVLLLRYLPERPAQPGGRITAARIYDSLVNQRWNPIATGAIVGVVGTFAYFRVEPLGVTSQISSLTRTIMDNAGMLEGRLNGLDTFSGCVAIVTQTITENGWLIIGMVMASLAVAVLGGRFKLSRLTLLNSVTALLGGVLMGWGGMLALGCTVGTLLSGISAFAVAGWVFAGAMFIGVWLGIRLKLDHTG